jgi:hypothetical protein
MHLSWSENKSAFPVECDSNLYALKITVCVQSEPMTDCLADGLFRFSFLNPKVLCVTFENLPFENSVILINRVKWRFNRAVWSLKNYLAIFVQPDVFKNVVWGILQPILRPAGLSHL